MMDYTHQTMCDGRHAVSIHILEYEFAKPLRAVATPLTLAYLTPANMH